jgi:hypothetical protein
VLRPRRQYRILQAAFLFALVGVAFFGAYAGYRAGEYPAYEQAKPHGGEQDILSALWHWATHDAAGFFTIVLCVITGLLAWVTYFLFIATRKIALDANETGERSLAASTTATDLARKTAEHQLRAYLGVVGGAICVTRNRELSVVLFVRNLGQTPAHNVRQFVSAEMREFESDAPGEMGEVGADNWVMSPGTTWPVRFPDRTKRLADGSITMQGLF